MTRIAAWTLPALLVLFFGVGDSAEPNESGYHVIKKFPLGEEGGWDYLTMDPDAHRLYISRATRVMVLDVDSGKLVGEVAKTPGVHGIALVPKRKRGYTSNGTEGTVTIFDTETLREIGRPKVGNRPDAIIYDPASDRVFTFNAGTKDATALNTEDGTVAGTVKLDGKPEGAVADEKGQVYVNLEDKNEVVAIDSKNLTVKNRWPVAKAPVGLGMDRVKRRLFVSCGSEKMGVLDADSGKVLATLPIGKGTDACVFDQDRGLAFSSNRDGTLTVVEEKPADQYRVVANVPTQVGARTMALDTKTHNIYLATARFKPAAPGQRRPTMEPDSFVILVVGTGGSK
jgi:DNA-binding beta-propeller fold protein YncE